MLEVIAILVLIGLFWRAIIFGAAIAVAVIGCALGGILVGAMVGLATGSPLVGFVVAIGASCWFTWCTLTASP